MEILSRKDIRFLVGGEMVLPLHGVSGKFTYLDLLIEAKENNIRRFVRSIRSENADLADTADLEKLPHGEGPLLRCLPLLIEVDFQLNALINSSLPYGEFFERKVSISMGSVMIDLLSLEDLLLIRSGTDE
jgi:hypothetical protein